MYEQELKLFVVLCKTFRTVSDIAKQDIKKHGLNLTEFEVLELLYSKGPQTIQDIGRRILLTSGSMTYVVDRLTEKGLVQRKNCEEDKRVIYAALTEQGEKILDDVFPAHAGCIADIFKGLSAEEIEQMTEGLKKISRLQKA